MKYTDPNVRPIPSHVDDFGIPAELKQHRHWVMWKFEYVDEKWTKVPYHPNNYKAASTKPENWSTFETVLTAYVQNKNKFDGIGFVFSADLPYIGIDLDECVTRTEDDFALNKFAAHVVDKLATYSEFSPSMTGLHCIGKAPWDGTGRKITWKGNVIEIYKTGRYFTFTGISWHEKILDIQDVEQDLTEIVSKLETPEVAAKVNMNLNVDKRIEMALKNPKIEQLFYGNTLDYGGDDSRADMALCSLLVYYCEGNKDLLDQMFRQSKLMRPKWDEHRGANTYGENTLTKALTGHQSYLSVRAKHIDKNRTFETRKNRRLKVNDLWDSVMDFRKNPLAQGVTTGWPALDDYYRPAKGLLTVVTGVPGSGKSTFVDVLIYNLAMKHNWRTTFASFESRPIQRHLLNLCQIHLAKPTYSFLPDSASNDEMEQARVEIQDKFNFLMPDQDELNMTSLLEYVDDDIREFGIDGFVLDPFTELDQSRPTNMRQDEYIEKLLRELQTFTSYRDIHSWLIAHPKISQETHKNGRPTMYSIAGAAHFNNKADYGFVVHRTDDNEVQVAVEKVRNDISGDRGTVTFRFDKRTKQYIELSKPVEYRNYSN